MSDLTAIDTPKSTGGKLFYRLDSGGTPLFYLCMVRRSSGAHQPTDRRRSFANDSSSGMASNFFDLKKRKEAAAASSSSKQKQSQNADRPRKSYTGRSHPLIETPYKRPELVKTRVLELNASDERGISIVREKVKNFAKIAISNASASTASKYPCPPYKIIILDEADSMTQDAQSALRRTMETYSKITRFCLICNYVTRIIDPLASRCSKFRFKPLDEGNARIRLSSIAQQESVRCQDGVIDMLIKVSDGDLRKAITFLQSAARLHGAVKAKDAGGGDDDMEVDGGSGGEKDAEVTVRSIEEIAGVIPDKTIDSLMDSMQPRPHGQAVYTPVAKVVQDIVADGWSAAQVLLQLYNRLVFSDMLTGNQKNEIVGIFSEMDKRLVDGADEHLVTLDMSLRIAAVFGHDGS
ncbi:replication factor C subunit 2 [Drechslerella dactyloides]|uniref:Replication factor C subunit 2 n=1 Tax=Drechslerella dactyloides TaxID=74499 RepID=A0AAD6ITP5_DREDA|nr:replication factor C subunit 2 [Drechslerella dactyloides]